MPTVLFVGSFPPRECGIATFTKDVVEHFDAHAGSQSDVIAVNDPGTHDYLYSPRVIAHIKQDDRSSYFAAADCANRHHCDVVNVQHEYGLFGGEHGAWCCDFIETARKPVALTLHTVLPSPTESHVVMTKRLCRGSARVVVLSETARRLLVDRYGISARDIRVIPHGAPYVPSSSRPAKALLGYRNRTVVSTFGLLSSGKGLEYAVAAMHETILCHPNVIYLILGATHPLIRRKEGERYRRLLQDRIDALGLHDHVMMIDRYLPLSELLLYLQATDIYLTPYLNPDQVVSGTLAYALAAGKAIISTPYLYAQELLARGRGVLVDFRDSRSIAAAIAALIEDGASRDAMCQRAYTYGKRMQWDVVALDYANAFEDLTEYRRDVALASVSM